MSAFFSGKNALVFIGLDKVVFQRISTSVFKGLDLGTVKNRAQFSNKRSG
jgi:hypothetical protein